MPRGRKAGSVTETLEQQIGKAQLKVIKTKQAYDTAVIKSEKTYDEILTFITAGQTTEEE